MPRIEPDTRVTMDERRAAELTYPPPQAELVVAVEDAALKARRSRLTTVVALDDQNTVTWVGSIDEAMLASSAAAVSSADIHARTLLTHRLLTGSHMWDVIHPGPLRRADVMIRDTVYRGDRLWVVIGELEINALLAVPLNDLGFGVRGHYECEIRAQHLLITKSKDSLLELNHIWSFPPSAAIGSVAHGAQHAIASALRGCFPGRVRR